MFKGRLLPVLICFFLFVSSLYGEQPTQLSSPHARVSIISEHYAYHLGTNWIGIKFELDPEWHVYWKNPGDSGSAPRFTFTVPKGVAVGDLQWPAPKRIPVAHLMNFGYENSVTLLVPFTVSEDFTAPTLAINAKGEWLVCKVDCIPGEGSFSLELPQNKVPVDRLATSEFELLRKQIPTLYRGEPIPYRITETTLSINIPPALRGGTPLLLPTINGIIKNAAAQTIDDSGVLSVTRDAANLVPKNFSALLLSANAVEVQLINESTPIEIQDKLFNSSLFTYAAFAFIGGLILNLMPCVLPVIGIKVFSLIEHAQSSPAHRRRYGLLFLLGVLLSLWAIWAAVMIARSVGMSLGWGFQLQESWFVISLSIALTLIALNLLGLFEVGSSIQRIFGSVRGRTPSIEALLSGFLTTLVATPCTAPFMGTSIAFAFTTDIFSSFLIFTSLGLGLGLPYLAFCISPSLMRLLPRPGQWMIRIRQLLALPLLATVAWLIWIYSLQVGNVPSNSLNNIYTDSYGLKWEQFSESLVDRLRNQGKIIYVDYTAAWCITCQVNKHVVFSSAEVREELKNNNVVLIRADWTVPSPEIEASIRSFGKAGVPLNIVYKPDVEPIILPNVLTPSIVINAIKG